MSLPTKKEAPKEPAIHKDFLEFQTDASEIAHTPVPRLARLTLHVVLVLITFLFVWSCLAEIEIFVSGSGRIVSSGKDVTVSALTDTVIRSIEVKVGQNVKAGDVLVRLDHTFTTAGETQAKFRLMRARLDVARLEAEIAQKPLVAPKDVPAEELKAAQELLRGRNEEFKARVSTYNTKIAETQSDITSLERVVATTKHQVDVSQEVMAMRTEVYRQGVDSKLSYLDAQNQLANITNQYEKAKADLASKKHNIQQLRSEKDAFIESRLNELKGKLAEANKEIATQSEELAKASRMTELSVLTAPVDAVVLEIGKFPSDSVVRTGEAIMTLVPLNTPLEAEVYIMPKDIGFLRVGDKCSLKLEAFPFLRHGMIFGKVRVVGEDAVNRDTATGKMSVYPARVSITDTHELRNIPDDFRIMPGMSLEANVTVGTRKVITYLLYPVMRAFNESIRER